MSSQPFRQLIVLSRVSLWPFGLYVARLLHWWDFPGKNTGLGCHFLLQGTFLTQESSPVLQADSLPLSHQASPYTLTTNRKDRWESRMALTSNAVMKIKAGAIWHPRVTGAYVPARPQESDHVTGSLKKDAIWQAHDCSNGCWGIVRVQVERAGTSGFHSNQTCHRLHMGPCGQPFPRITRGFGAVSVSNSPPPSHVTSASSGRRRRRAG